MVYFGGLDGAAGGLYPAFTAVALEDVAAGSAPLGGGVDVHQAAVGLQVRTLQFGNILNFEWAVNILVGVGFPRGQRFTAERTVVRAYRLASTRAFALSPPASRSWITGLLVGGVEVVVDRLHHPRQAATPIGDRTSVALGGFALMSWLGGSASVGVGCLPSSRVGEECEVGESVHEFGEFGEVVDDRRYTSVCLCFQTGDLTFQGVDVFRVLDRSTFPFTHPVSPPFPPKAKKSNARW